MQFDESIEKCLYPFKFNHYWLQELDFNTLVPSTWKLMDSLKDRSIVQLLVNKLKYLKEEVIKWKVVKKRNMKEELSDLEQKMDKTFQCYPSQIFPLDVKDCLISFEKRKYEILNLEEDSWCLKSRAIWLKSGDKNTYFFHKHVEFHRKLNTIWDIKDMEGKTHFSQKYGRSTAFDFFRQQYKAIEKKILFCSFRY